MLKTAELYDMSHTLAGAYLSGFEYPWQALKGIKELILALGPTLGEDYTEVSPTVWVHKTAAVAPLRLHPRLRAGRRRLRGRQFRGAEKRNSFRQRAGSPL